MRPGWMPSPDETAVLVPEETYTIAFREVQIVKEGKNATIVTVSRMVYETLWSAKELEKDGISAEIIDPRRLIPLHKKSVINSAKKTGRLLVVDEDSGSYGMTGEIVSLV
jgi:pyruvate dehydrogenase E1 component beta subunit